MALRLRASTPWSIRDSYGFIATYVELHIRHYGHEAFDTPTTSSCLGSRSRTVLVKSRPPRSRQLSSNSNGGYTATASSTEKQHNSPLSTSSPSSSSSSHVVRRSFHNYFVTHLPSSSTHPDSRARPGPHHQLPRGAAAPHVPHPGSSPAASPPHVALNRDLTVVRIPLRSAKHHFGVAESRGQRPYNEDTNQAGTIDIPSFAKRAPISLVRSATKRSGEGTSADSPLGDPQIFYFAVFDGHGGTQCSQFLRDELHGYIEEAAAEFELQSSLRRHGHDREMRKTRPEILVTQLVADSQGGGEETLDNVDLRTAEEAGEEAQIPELNASGAIQEVSRAHAEKGARPAPAVVNETKALKLQKDLVREYKQTVGGYFRRFSPEHFDLETCESEKSTVSVESVLTYAFLRADLDYIAAQARKPDPDDPYILDAALNDDEVLGRPNHMPPSGHGIGGRTRFKGGSTASVALISTPTPAPFWHPAASSTLLVAHVGDTRILLCETATGLAKPLTTDHHPGLPGESHRLRRFATSLVADSFGEERIQGLANSRAFGDMSSKRLGVSAEPEITRTDLEPAQYSFMVLMSDGVSGSLSDQEVVDIVKEARTPEQGAKDVVSYSTEVTHDGDNATCLVVRLGGWERRSEGGLGSLGTKEVRDFRLKDANDPRRAIR